MLSDLAAPAPASALSGSPPAASSEPSRAGRPAPPGGPAAPQTTLRTADGRFVDVHLGLNSLALRSPHRLSKVLPHRPRRVPGAPALPLPLERRKPHRLASDEGCRPDQNAHSRVLAMRHRPRRDRCLTPTGLSPLTPISPPFQEPSPAPLEPSVGRQRAHRHRQHLAIHTRTRTGGRTDPSTHCASHSATVLRTPCRPTAQFIHRHACGQPNNAAAPHHQRARLTRLDPSVQALRFQPCYPRHADRVSPSIQCHFARTTRRRPRASQYPTLDERVDLAVAA